MNQLQLKSVNQSNKSSWMVWRKESWIDWFWFQVDSFRFHFLLIVICWLFASAHFIHSLILSPPNPAPTTILSSPAFHFMIELHYSFSSFIHLSSCSFKLEFTACFHEFHFIPFIQPLSNQSFFVVDIRLINSYCGKQFRKRKFTKPSGERINQQLQSAFLSFSGFACGFFLFGFRQLNWKFSSIPLINN